MRLLPRGLTAIAYGNKSYLCGLREEQILEAARDDIGTEDLNNLPQGPKESPVADGLGAHDRALIGHPHRPGHDGHLDLLSAP